MIRLEQPSARANGGLSGRPVVREIDAQHGRGRYLSQVSPITSTAGRKFGQSSSGRVAEGDDRFGTVGGARATWAPSEAAFADARAEGDGRGGDPRGEDGGSRCATSAGAPVDGGRSERE